MASSTRSATPSESKARGEDEPSGGWRPYLRALGPGLVTGAADDDPSGIATYSQAGARFGYGLLWTALITLPLMSAVAETCDRTALATGQGLGELAVKRFSSWVRRGLIALLAVLIAANALNIAADLVAIGEGMKLLGLGPSWLWGPIAGAAVLVLVTTGSFERIAVVFKLLCLSLLAYLGVLVLAHPSWVEVASHTFVPHIEVSGEYAALLVAVLGTTISPYLFFWQSAHRVEELDSETDAKAKDRDLENLPKQEAKQKERTSRVDVFTGMAFSNVVMFAIVIAGAQLAAKGTTDISSAAQAADALRPVAGSFAKVLFALGFIGSGLLAVPVLAGSGAMGLSGLLHKRWGYSRSARRAPVFYGLVAAGTVGGIALSLLHANPIQLLVIVAMVNGLAAAPFLVVVMLIANDRKIMKDHRNGRAANILVGVAIALMALSSIVLIATGGGS